MFTDSIGLDRRLSRDEALELYLRADLFELGRLAAQISERKNKGYAFFIKNIHINPTNLCINRCKFCAFSKSKGEKGAFELTIDEILNRINCYLSDGTRFSEVHIVGGLHPEWSFQYYVDMIAAIKDAFPFLTIKAFTATEIDYFSRISGLSIGRVLDILKTKGLALMPGGGAEIFDEEIRKRLCPEKISSSRWLEIMKTAHRIGIRSNATMLYGHIERPEHRIDHLLRLRELQDRTGGFQAFIPLPYQRHKGADITTTQVSAITDLKTIAISRLVLDNFDHIKAYWVMLGEKVAQVALQWGADDIEGTVMEEKISHSAGSETPQGLIEDELIRLIKKAGRIPAERDSFYNIIKKF